MCDTTLTSLVKANKGVMSNYSGIQAIGTGTKQLTPLPGTDYIIGVRVDIVGIAQIGTVSYQLDDGAFIEAGYGNNDRVVCFIPTNNQLNFTIINNQSSGSVYYNVVYICLTADDYDCYVRQA